MDPHRLQAELDAALDRARAAERRAVRLDELERSFDWRVFCLFREAVNRLVPRGSRQFAAAQTLIGILLSFRRHGFWAGLRDTAFCFREAVRSATRSMRGPLDPIAGSVPAAPPPLAPRKGSVDIVVCVHNALEDVRRCLSSVLAHTAAPYRLILVDDGSGPETAAYLSEFARAQGAVLLRNPTARGYTCAANQGLRAGRADHVVLLNSDTIVTPEWLDRLVACVESDPSLAAAGPLSNTASWQSVPELFRDDGDWADNPLPAPFSPAEFARALARCSARLYPRLPFLNGFCLLLRRAAIHHVGRFDERRFEKGYGEENDWALRARRAGWQLAVADDAWIQHAQSRSYTGERRLTLAQNADATLRRKYGNRAVDEGVKACRHDRTLLGVRSRVRVLPERERLRDQGRARWEGRRVLFLLPVRDAGGGAHVVLQEAAAMRTMGVDARVLNLNVHRALFERSYPNLTVPVLYAHRDPAREVDFSAYDAVVATVYSTVPWLDEIAGLRPRVRAYYIQDYEPWFFPPDAPARAQAHDSYRLFPDLVRFTKTEWTRARIEELESVPVQLVGPSVDIDLFRPRPGRVLRGRQPIRVAAMVRPDTPRRAADATMRILREVERRHGRRVAIHLFGCAPYRPDFLELPRDFRFSHAGVLHRLQAARLFSQMDVFLDASEFQAMGLTALEAMACGVAVLVPQEGGSASFARHEANALVIDTKNEDACVAALDRLLTDEALRGRLANQAAADACQFHPEGAAYRMMEVLLG